jgi:glutamine---fructose-6-phosphate transaminase (isomerizing)
VTTSAMASEIGESADVVAKIVRNRPATRDIAQRIGIGSAPLCVVRGRGSSVHAGVFLRYLVETRLRLPISSAPSVITAFRTSLMLRHALFIVIAIRAQPGSYRGDQVGARRGRPHYRHRQCDVIAGG